MSERPTVDREELDALIRDADARAEAARREWLAARHEAEQLRALHPFGNRTGKTQELLDFVEEHPGCLASEVGAAIGRRDAQSLLGPLVARGFLRREGAPRRGRYFLVRRPQRACGR